MSAVVSHETEAKPNPTAEQFEAYRNLYAYFNRELFDGRLSPVILNFSRLAKTYGFFSPERWVSGESVTHEISLNPSYLSTRPAREVVSTLVHEMAHLWQQECGKPSRRGYHNAEWAAKMEAIGLMPSSTGAPGGKRVGQHMTHYIIEGGPFAKAFERMPSEYLLPWATREELPKERTAAKKRTKVKYTCPECGANVWGKPKLSVACGECGVPFECEDPDEDAEGDES